jgi:hypothetical protein
MKLVHCKREWEIRFVERTKFSLGWSAGQEITRTFWTRRFITVFKRARKPLFTCPWSQSFSRIYVYSKWSTPYRCCFPPLFNITSKQCCIKRHYQNSRDSDDRTTLISQAIACLLDTTIFRGSSRTQLNLVNIDRSESDISLPVRRIIKGKCNWAQVFRQCSHLEIINIPPQGK